MRLPNAMTAGVLRGANDHFLKVGCRVLRPTTPGRNRRYFDRTAGDQRARDAFHTSRQSVQRQSRSSDGVGAVVTDACDPQLGHVGPGTVPR